MGKAQVVLYSEGESEARKTQKKNCALIKLARGAARRRRSIPGEPHTLPLRVASQHTHQPPSLPLLERARSTAQSSQFAALHSTRGAAQRA